MYSTHAIRRPLLGAALALALGSVLGDAFVDVRPAAAPVLMLWMGAFLRGRPSGLLYSVPLFVLGAWVGHRVPPAPVAPPTGESAGLVVEGVLLETPGLPESDRTLLLEMTGSAPVMRGELEPAQGRAWVRVRGARRSLCGAPGDRLRVWGRARRPAPAFWVGDEARVERLRKKGVVLFLSVASVRRCVVVRSGAAGGVRIAAERIRAGVQAAIDTRLDASSSALVRALAIGDRSSVSRSVQSAFRDSGLQHLMAISGLHLAVVAGGLFFLLSRLLRRSERTALWLGADRAAAVLCLPAVVGYTFLVGAPPSAVRAAVMIGVLLTGRAVARSTDVWTALGLALLAAWLRNPRALADVSVLLSFGAVAGLIGLYPSIRMRRERGPAIRFVVEAAMVSVVATLVTLPIVAVHFHRVSLVGVMANVVVGPIASFLLVPLSLLAGVVAGAEAALQVESPVASVALGLAGVVSIGVEWAAARFASLPFAAQTIAAPSLLACVLYYSGGVLAARQGRRRTWGAVFLLLSFSTYGLGVSETDVFELGRTSDRLSAVFLPVGQGDAVVLSLPGGEVVVVDTGPRGKTHTAAERVVEPFLRDRGIRRIDLLVITHPHRDHDGGLAVLLDRFEVSEIWWNGDPRSAWPEDPRARVARPGYARAYGLVGIEVIGPRRPAARYDDPNDASLVLRVRYGEHRLLLTGDIEALAEAELLASAELSAQVMKAPHHGSSTSSTEAFLDAVAPEHVVFTTGYRNRFGFPHEDVLSRVSARGARIWRTDLHGLVEFVSDGQTLEVSGYRDPNQSSARTSNSRSTSRSSL